MLNTSLPSAFLLPYKLPAWGGGSHVGPVAQAQPQPGPLCPPWLGCDTCQECPVLLQGTAVPLQVGHTQQETGASGEPVSL